ncbi:MAM domain-containing protein 2-like [Plectropomus leopardus]|uniref:MAM domain-containing protein 2-like n=1 Tax=Plectropomus leopardus TaxID=160734 RepID=UPI001C4BA1AA|nr:MAM domain-containing protein 2-like [Plectropomus leopardus]
MLPFYLLTFAATIQAHNQLLPGSCNFESNTCGYTSDADFTTWTLHKDGRFVAVEVAMSDDQDDEISTDTGTQREITGVLLSPALEQGDWSCLRLVYQIIGSGSLEVLQRTEGKSFDKPLWSSQTPSDSWVISSMDLQNNTEPYRVVIEGKPGRSAGSSVAIFEIHISPGYCLECDFEESHLCGYSNQWNANVNWYVGGGGGTQLLHNNIPNDHTYNNKTGHLMYVDSIYAKTFKEVAKLVSPMTTVPMYGCLSFQYQRSEEGGNLFSVYTRDQLGQYQELWRAGTENQNEWSVEEWIPVQVDLKAPYAVQVVFEVSFNSPRGGRVALDDISFSPEFCSKDTEPTFDPSIANCDFESGLCRYIQEPVTGSSWRRVSVKPNIFRNGDHTTGAGYFLLAHSGLSPHSGYVSRLNGPTLPGNMKFCLRFFFSLRGFNQTDQALAVYLQQQQSGIQEKIWTQGEKSRGIWITTDVTFQTTQPAKVVFVSTCRSFWDCGSVALDDISVRLGDCELTAGSLSSSLPGHCDFEAGLCGYTQDKEGDGADWEWRRGPTPTSYTGPRGDHTTGLGYYLHMEASPMLPGQSVRLLSRPLRGSWGPQCLRFYYHMYGSGTGQLSVHLHKDGEDMLLWQLSGEQSIAWLRATVEYQSDCQHQIVFEATRGSSVRSDIAIDDIIFEGGPCPEIEIKATVGTSNEIE